MKGSVRCADCGDAFSPALPTQKRCPACRARRVAEAKDAARSPMAKRRCASCGERFVPESDGQMRCRTCRRRPFSPKAAHRDAA